MAELDQVSSRKKSTEKSSSWFRRICCSILQSGSIPHHIAIIMDGNRRFAKKMKQDRSFGHLLGFEKLTETLEWCLDLGVTEVTVYAFSIYNFQRSQDEVDGLMELAKQKLAVLLEESDLIKRYGVCIRVLGDLELLPREVQEAVARCVKLTKDNNKVFLNVCFSYASCYEITEAIRRLVDGSKEGKIYPSDVSEDLLERCLYTGDSPPPDLVIRTSGEVRLSDFLLWQSSHSCLCFQDVLWPEFSIWNFFSSIITYQQNHEAIQEARQFMYSERQSKQYESDKQCVLEKLHRDGRQEVSPSELEESVAEYAVERQRRTDSFVQYVRSKRVLYLEQFGSL